MGGLTVAWHKDVRLLIVEGIETDEIIGMWNVIDQVSIFTLSQLYLRIS